MAKEAVSPQLLRLELHVFEVLWWCFKWDLWGFALQNGSFIAASLCLVNGGALYFSACQEAVFSTPAREPGFKPRPCWRSWAPHSLEFGFEKSCSTTKSIISIILHVRVFKMQLQKSIFYHNSLYSTLCGKYCCWTKGRYSISNGISAAGCVGQRSQSAVQTGKVRADLSFDTSWYVQTVWTAERYWQIHSKSQGKQRELLYYQHSDFII